uniref:Uncharacterized protein n=1 Tax=Lepeophtheirus salmonis TaxID=72036 RepID=A0A0K2UDS9_LEPSM
MFGSDLTNNTPSRISQAWGTGKIILWNCSLLYKSDTMIDVIKKNLV